MNIQKKSLTLLGIFLFGSILIFSAFYTANAEPAIRQSKPNPMLIVKGAKAWKENCGRCHNLRSPRELTDEEWDVSVSHMRVRANLTKGEADAIRAFLKASN